MEAKINIRRFTPNNPAPIVNNLYGIGVKPEIRTVKKVFELYKLETVTKTSCKLYKSIRNCPTALKNNAPTKYPNNPPNTENIVVIDA